MTIIRKLFLEPAEARLIQFLRYGVVSVISLAIDFGLLYAATEYAGLHYLLSAIISYSLGLIVNYLLSILWAFPHSRLRSRPLEFLIFVVIGLAGLGLNEVLLWLFTEVAHFHYMVSRSIAAVIGFLWKFVIRKVVLFTSRKSEQNVSGLPQDVVQPKPLRSFGHEGQRNSARKR